MAIMLEPAALQTTITAFGGATIADAWIKVARSAAFAEEAPTVLVVGSALEFEGASRQLAARHELSALCDQLAAALRMHGFNLINGACPGLPDEVMKAFCMEEREGVAVGLSAYPNPIEHMAGKPFAPAGFPLTADVTVFCGSGFELLNVYNTLCADILVVIGGGVGTLLEVATAIEQELPVICLAPSGGVARDVEAMLRRFIANFKEFRVYTVDTLQEVNRLLSTFAQEFRRKGRVSRLTPLVRDVSEQTGSIDEGVTITISSDAEAVTYRHLSTNVTLHRPLVLTDRARLARIPSRGETILTALDEHPRIYVVDGISTILSPRQRRVVWGPSIDTIVLLQAVKSSETRRAQRALEVGTGCGLLALWLVGTDRADHAVGIDTDRAAVLTALWNAERLGLSDRCLFKVSAFSDLTADTFDLILCNPPYLPVPHHRRHSAYGGTDLLREFLSDYDKVLDRDGSCYLVISSASYLDREVAAKLEALAADGHARLMSRRDVPLKVGAVLGDHEWIAMLLGGGGITERDADDYRYWHTLELWCLRAAVEAEFAAEELEHAPLP